MSQQDPGEDYFEERQPLVNGRAVARRSTNFAELRNHLQSDELSSLEQDIFCDLFICVFMIVLIKVYGHEVECGIPMTEWESTYFIILVLKSINNGIRMYAISNFYRYANQYSVVSYVAIEGVFLIWLIYGNIIFYSKDNDCKTNEKNKDFYNAMQGLLIIGYFQMLVYTFVIVVFFIFICCRDRLMPRRGGGIPQQGVPQVIQSLKRIKFGEGDFQNEQQCIICYNDFKEDDEVTPLSCDPRHYFHTECIKGWIESRQNTCPLCRQEIAPINL